MARFITRSNADVDPRLLSWFRAAAANSPYDVALTSGYRQGDPRYHGQHAAADVRLIDPATGREIPNYQDAASFAPYQQFANLVRAEQMRSNPDAANLLRWGGYFSGPRGKYGAMDLMHFDLGGGTTPMGGGGWDTGLTPQQAAIWGLSAGGGASPPAGAGDSQLASVFTDAIAPQEETAAKPRRTERTPQPTLVKGPGADAPTPMLETASAIPATPASVAAEPEQDILSPLAKLFRVRKDIGTASSTRAA